MHVKSEMKPGAISAAVVLMVSCGEASQPHWSGVVTA